MHARVEIPFDGDSVPANVYAHAGAPVLVLAHGAGAGQAHPFMVQMAEGLAARGVEVMTFDFPYTAHGRRAPDRAPVLEACFRTVLCAARERAKGRALFAGGKSMGGRIASQIAPGEEALAGLVFLGYPLHPPGKPAQLRVKHLPQIVAPMLFVQGERDPFGTPDELAPFVEPLRPRAELFTVGGGDHSFAIPKRMGSQADVMARVQDRVAQWIAERAG